MDIAKMRLQEFCRGRSNAFDGNYPEVKDIKAWMELAERFSVPKPRICEINMGSTTLARSLLCKRVAADTTRWEMTKYTGLAYRNITLFSTLSFGSVAVGTRGMMRYADTGRSVLPASAGIPESSCDVLIIDAQDSDAKHRQSLLSDIPNLLRRLASPQNLLVIHGSSCSSINIYNRSNPDNVKAWREANNCQARHLASCAGSGDWCIRFDELASTGSISFPLCRPSTTSTFHWCAGVLDTRSICTVGEGWLDRTREVETGALRLIPSLSKISVKLTGAAGHSNKHGYTQEWRYYSAFSCHNNSSGSTNSVEAICLMFKNSMYEGWTGGITSADGKSFLLQPELVLPVDWYVKPNEKRELMRMTHNMALLRHLDEYIVVGGQSRPSTKKHPLHEKGIFIVKGSSWRYSGDSNRLILAQEADAYRFGRYESPKARSAARDMLVQAARWRDLRPLLDGRHPGCIERRDANKMDWLQPGVCEFDGRLSLAHFGGEFFLYARANPAAHGQRFVQFTKSRNLVNWTSFNLIEINSYNFSQGDIYFFSAQKNPVHNSSLIAIFPLVHRMRGCIALSVSLDGFKWSSPVSLLKCAVYGERTRDHPVGEQALAFNLPTPK